MKLIEYLWAAKIIQATLIQVILYGALIFLSEWRWKRLETTTNSPTIIEKKEVKKISSKRKKKAKRFFKTPGDSSLHR